MDTSIICECSNLKFWYFGNFVRCPECYNEYKETSLKEILLRRFNKETKQYNSNWEAWKKET